LDTHITGEGCRWQIDSTSNAFERKMVRSRVPEKSSVILGCSDRAHCERAAEVKTKIALGLAT
jgi:hypothetical protein